VCAVRCAGPVYGSRPPRTSTRPLRPPAKSIILRYYRVFDLWGVESRPKGSRIWKSMSNNFKTTQLSCVHVLLDCHVAIGGNISSRSMLARTATWTVQEQGSSSNLSGFLGSRARSLRWCIHLDVVLNPRAYRSWIVLMGNSFFRYYRDLCMHKYAIDEMTPHLFFLTVQRHPIACLSHTWSPSTFFKEN